MPKYYSTATFVKSLILLLLIVESVTIYLIRNIVPRFITEALAGCMAFTWALAVAFTRGRSTRRFMQSGVMFDILCCSFTIAWGGILCHIGPMETLKVTLAIPGMLLILLGAVVFVYSVPVFFHGQVNFRKSLFGQHFSKIFGDVEKPDSKACVRDGKLLATACCDINTYTWDIAGIVKEAGLEDLLLNSKANQSVLHASATRLLVQRRPPAYRVPQGFFDGVPPNRSHSSARNYPYSSASPGTTRLSCLFHRNRNPSSAHATSPSSPFDWARNILKRRRQRGEGIAFQGSGPAVVEVPYAKGKRRNTCAREKRRTLFPPKIPTASSSRPPKLNATQSSVN
ncbi:uncharacterized protein HD556DRAFT_1528613 [Suillus plorans]|uniref:Uncharacterized protein n=1 Tax=Suillus plorans TaxID=116603 RepID=A0A9P7DEL9_9AGAM|nr:uncharacterized protein HD556DRAFT_1528613 [Suillus plorans]KAG1791066.1 hypothetical protein HD556DRAFT_1528613 [Suillus plorans]